MKIVVINGSPKGENSATILITKAFLDGMGETAEFINTIRADVKPCHGCYACWHRTPGKCIQKDAMADILEKIKTSDIVIWSTPLYCYSFPSNMKAVIDRLLPLTTSAQRVDEDGSVYHPQRDRIAQNVIISGCGFPTIENNYEGFIFQCKKIFTDDVPMILCCEAPLLTTKEAQPVALPYLEKVRKAGAEFKKTFKISNETFEELKKPMFDPDMYRKIASNET